MRGKKTGGRVKGTRNLINQSVELTAERMGINFFEALCFYAKGDWKSLGYEAESYFLEKADGAVKMGYCISPETRFQAIVAGCKYLYSQKQAVQLSTGDTGIKIIIEDYLKK